MTRMLDFEDFKREYQKVPVEEYPNNVLEAVPEPMVSVQISTYQHADFIRDCLDGVLMQETDFPVEILIGEDESDDGTREICKEYADRHPDKIRLFLHRRENNIKIHGRPTGKFQSTYTRFKCRGKYIAMCEGDDYWTDPQKLQKQAERLENNGKISLVYHPFIIKNGTKERLIESKTYLPHISTCTYRAKLLVPKIRDMKVLNGDSMMCFKLRKKGKFENINDISPSVYRRHDKGMWSSCNKLDNSVAAAMSFLEISKVTKSNPELQSEALTKLSYFFENILCNYRIGKSGEILRLVLDIIGAGYAIQVIEKIDTIRIVSKYEGKIRRSVSKILPGDV